MNVCSLERGDERAWDEYVHRCPTATQSQLSGWRRVIETVYGHATHYLWVREEGVAIGILPLVLIRSFLFGRTLVSLPFLDDGGICVVDDEVRLELYERCLQLGHEFRADFIDLRHRLPNRLPLASNGSKVTFELELVADPDRMWKSFKAKLRNQIRKATKSGLTASWCEADELSSFYDVFATNMRDLGSPVHSRRFFAAIFEEFSDSVKLLLIRNGGQVIGGGLCLLFRETMTMPWASSRRDCLSMCPNNLLYWEAIRWGCENGYKKFDFGRSTPGSGTYHFKKQWGAIEEPLHWQCVRKSGTDSNTVSSDDPKYRWAIRVWSSLPVAITNFVGPILRRQMSN